MSLNVLLILLPRRPACTDGTLWNREERRKTFRSNLPWWARICSWCMKHPFRTTITQLSTNASSKHPPSLPACIAVPQDNDKWRSYWLRLPFRKKIRENLQKACNFCTRHQQSLLECSANLALAVRRTQIVSVDHVMLAWMSLNDSTTLLKSRSNHLCLWSWNPALLALELSRKRTNHVLLRIIHLFFPCAWPNFSVSPVPIADERQTERMNLLHRIRIRVLQVPIRLLWSNGDGTDQPRYPYYHPTISSNVTSVILCWTGFRLSSRGISSSVVFESCTRFWPEFDCTDGWCN